MKLSNRIVTGLMIAAVSLCYATPTSAVSLKKAAAIDCDTNDLSNPCYHVVAPNGGETFHIGDTMRIVVTSYRIGGGAGLDLIFGQNDLSILSQLNVSGNLYPYIDSVYKFYIPESLYVPFYNTQTHQADQRAVSTISAQCKIKVFDYNTASLYDESDAYFSIVARQDNPVIRTGQIKGKNAGGFATVLRGPSGISVKSHWPEAAVYTLKGVLVKRLVRSGDSFFWDLTDGKNCHVYRGAYLIALKNKGTETKKMICVY
jgi:hypothetical protein